MREKLRKLYERAVVLLQATPAHAAAAVAFLTAVQTQLVPMLPVAWQAKALATLATVSASLGAIVKAVAAVTPVKPAERGLLPVDTPAD